MNLKQALEIVVSLSKPSKMPCFGYSIPAENCHVGSALRNVEGSVCSKCYACKGFYMFKIPKTCLEKRLAATKDSNWVKAMIVAISNMEFSGYFRWFDSGDLQDEIMLDNICTIARALPQIKFWLPTKEYSIVSEYVKHAKIPENLIIRLSGYMIDGPAPAAIANKVGAVTSTVVSNENQASCKAYLNAGKCGLCRSCWDKNIVNISYPKH